LRSDILVYILSSFCIHVISTQITFADESFLCDKKKQNTVVTMTFLVNIDMTQ
jgi:hypothetical protein